MADFTTEELKQALEELAEEERALSQEQLGPLPEHAFSPSFEKKMARLLGGKGKPAAKRRPFTGRRAAAAGAFLLAGAVLAIGAGALPNLFFRITEEPSQGRTDVRFDPALPDYAYPEEFSPYRLARVPDGFALMVEDTDPVLFSRLEIYFRGSQRIFFTQELAQCAGFSLKTEDGGTRRQEQGSREMVSYSDGCRQYVFWTQGDYAFSLSGELPVEELLALTEFVEAQGGGQG